MVVAQVLSVEWKNAFAAGFWWMGGFVVCVAVRALDSRCFSCIGVAQVLSAGWKNAFAAGFWWMGGFVVCVAVRASDSRLL